jgi:hypothetical protein
MRREAGFVRLPVHEFLGAADAADQKEAEQLLVQRMAYWDRPVVHPGGEVAARSNRTPRGRRQRAAKGDPGGQPR